MKKTLSILLVLVMVLTMFAGCGNNGQTTPTGTATEPTANVVDYANATVILYSGNVRGNVEVYSQIAAAKALYSAPAPSGGPHCLSHRICGGGHDARTV